MFANRSRSKCANSVKLRCVEPKLPQNPLHQSFGKSSKSWRIDGWMLGYQVARMYAHERDFYVAPRRYIFILFVVDVLTKEEGCSNHDGDNGGYDLDDK